MTTTPVDPTTSFDPTLEPNRDDIRTVSFVSLGCPKNLVDSEKMLGELAQHGLMPVSAEAVENAELDEADDLSIAGSEQDASAAGGRVTPADAVVVNTCGFLEASKQESLSVIREAVEKKNRGEVKRVVVAGCLVQRHRAKILDWVPGIDAMVGVFDRDKITEAVRGAPVVRETDAQVAEKAAPYWISANALSKAQTMGKETVGLTVHGKDGKGIGYFESDSSRLRLTPRHYAYLRISEGCNQNCAFCTIPSIRGKMRSKGIEGIVAEAGELLRDGAHELLLIGQDTTSYGDDIGVGLKDQPNAERFAAGLPKLLKGVSDAVTKEIGSGWVRLMYAYPNNFTDEIIDSFAELVTNGNLLPYVDIPLQHASDAMLTAMRRNVAASQQLELMHKLRERIPGMAIRTTFITGFPGETEADHEQLIEFIEEVGFDAVGCFRYSKETGTVAGRLEDDPKLAVPEAVKQRRHDELMAVQQQIAFDQARFVADQFDESDPMNTGLRFDVIVDTPMGEAEEGGYIARGRTYFQAPQIDASTYVVSRSPLTAGELVRCVVVDAEGYDLVARPAEEFQKVASLPILR